MRRIGGVDAIALVISVLLVCVLPMRAPVASPLDKELLKSIPASVTDEELVSAFIAEPVYRWRRALRIYVDFGVWVDPEFADCFIDSLRKGLTWSGWTSEVLEFEFPRDRSDANFVLYFTRGDPESACGDASEEEPRKYVLVRPPNAQGCVAMWVRSGEITYAEAHISLDALKHTFEFFQVIKGSCSVIYAKNSVVYGTGYFARRRFETLPKSAIEQHFGELDYLFFQMLYRALPGPEPDANKVREVISRALKEGRR